MQQEACKQGRHGRTSCGCRACARAFAAYRNPTRGGLRAHVAGAGRVRLVGAGETEARAARAGRLAVHLAIAAQRAPAVRHARAPAHLRVVLPATARVPRRQSASFCPSGCTGKPRSCALACNALPRAAGALPLAPPHVCRALLPASCCKRHVLRGGCDGCTSHAPEKTSCSCACVAGQQQYGQEGEEGAAPHLDIGFEEASLVALQQHGIPANQRLHLTTEGGSM